MKTFQKRSPRLPARLTGSYFLEEIAAMLENTKNREQQDRPHGSRKEVATRQ